MHILIIVAIWAVMGLAFAGLILYAFAQDKKRREALQQKATELGLAFSPELPPQDAQLFDQFKLANRGRSRKATSVILADTGETRMVLFDYQFTTGSGKSSKRHRQSVVLLSAEDLALPVFQLSPESFFHRLADFFGQSDIDFKDDADFSDAFLLHGDDEEAVRNFFDASLRVELLKYPQTHVEGRQNSFLFYYPNKSLDADSVHRLMEDAFAIYMLLNRNDTTYS